MQKYFTVLSSNMAYVTQGRIQTGFHRFTETGQIFSRTQEILF